MIRIALIGIGNCACTLLQSLQVARGGNLSFVSQIPGLIGFDPSEVEVIAAFDISNLKVGLDLADAVVAEPNCTTIYHPLQPTGVSVSPGILEDGIDGPLRNIISVAQGVSNDIDHVTAILRDRAVDLLLLYLPVGSQRAAEAYAEAALRSGCGLINCTPAVIACSEEYQEKFSALKLPLLGDDMRSHIGSTTLHQALLAQLGARGVKVSKTYQLNIGGNTDFLNMRDPARAAAKRNTKHASLTDLLPEDAQFGVGPSDYVPYLHDRKIGYIHIEGEGFLNMPFSIELRLEVEDSPNAAPVALDAVRLAAALKAGVDVNQAAALAALFKRPRQAD
jgi:myo-inositol-1-phosphate synthase